MPVRVKFDGQLAARAYGSAFRRLAALPGFDGRQVLRSEVGSILKTWAGRTKVATQGKVDRRARLKAVRDLGYTRGNERGDVTVNAGFRPAPFGRVWIRVREGPGKNNWILAKGPNFSAPSGSAKFTMFRRKLYNGGDTDRSTSFQWMENVNYATRQVQQRIKEAIPAARRSIGFSRQSVLQIADALGIDLASVAGGALSGAGIAKARAALASNGRAYRNGSGMLTGTQVKAYAHIVNSLPFNTKIGMDRTLAGVLAGRAKFIDTAWRKGTFNSLSNTARAFPNLIRVAV